MGNKLFGADIAGKIARSLGPKLPRGVLSKEVQGSRDPDNLAGGRSGTSTSHTFRGIRIGLESLRKDTILPDARDAVLIIGDTIRPAAIPVTNDKVLVESITFTVVGVSRDPDAATYTCQVK